MALSTFGAIMGFAAEITGQTGEIYKTLAKKAKGLPLREVLQVLSVEEGKSHSLMERTRRENVTEMILEPITGLHQEDYGVDLKVVDPMEDADLLRVALILEERERRSSSMMYPSKYPFRKWPGFFEKWPRRNRKIWRNSRALRWITL